VGHVPRFGANAAIVTPANRLMAQRVTALHTAEFYPHPFHRLSLLFGLILPP
jgi:hypothetical protein